MAALPGGQRGQAVRAELVFARRADHHGPQGQALILQLADLCEPQQAQDPMHGISAALRCHLRLRHRHAAHAAGRARLQRWRSRCRQGLHAVR